MVSHVAVDVVISVDADNRTKDLIGADAGVVRRIQEHGWGVATV